MAQIKSSLPAINVPISETETGLPTTVFYRFIETLFKRTGGVNGDRTASVEVRLTQAEDDIDALDVAKADKSVTITAGNGLTGDHNLSSGFTIDAVQNTGWTTGTGTENKGAYATYTAPTISNPPTQIEVQALADALQAATRRILALEAALRSNGAIN